MEGLTLIEQYLEVGVGLAEPARLLAMTLHFL
jgi:hypothetical protein